MIRQITAHATKKPHTGGKGKKSIKHMIVKPAMNGGATVEHHFNSPDGTDYGPAPTMESHAFSKPKDAAKHVQSMLEGMPGGMANQQVSGDTEPDGDE